MERAQREEVHGWMTRLAFGDRAAFTPLFAALLPLVSGFAARSLPAEEAEDVAQLALLKVFSRAVEFDPAQDAVSWVVGIAAWEVRTARAKARRRRDTAPVPLERADEAPGPEEAALAADLLRAAEEALGRLSPLDAETIRAASRGERPAHVAPAAFRKRLERALTRLRAIWRPE